MRFPAKIKYRGQVRAKIYANEGGYRLYWRATVAGKRQSLFKSFRTYSEAKKEAHKVVKQLYEGSAATTLTANQASDAVAAHFPSGRDFGDLRGYHQTWRTPIERMR
jgi:hypothetical protein